jgi:multidrug efflux pump subunit AcrB
MPGASAEDVERRITSPIEDAIQNVTDIRFVISQSRDNLSTILIRFNDLSTRDFDKRISDLRREIQNKESELPDAAEQPFVFEITTSNGFPTATVLVVGPAYDEGLRRYAKRINKELTNFREVDRVTDYGFTEPELHVNFFPEKLTALGLNPTDVSNNIASAFQDSSAGDVSVGNQNWLVRLSGVYNDPAKLGNTLIKTKVGDIPLNAIANVQRGREELSELVTYDGKPAIMLSIAKSPNVNTLKMVERIRTHIDERNQLAEQIGAELVLVDDQTELTRSALRVMQGNALLGLFMVLLVTFIFLGLKMSLLTSIAIPFILAGVFWVLNTQGETLNVMVLLGVIISLGMLVDDAVVVVEAIYYRLERGVDNVTAAIEGLKEVVAPVTASVLTTIAAFLPLMLLPGILGQFLKVVPIVVTLALLISLIEAYWMLPAHIIGFKVKLNNSGGVQKRRRLFLRSLRHHYSQLLIKALRYPLRITAASLGALTLAIVFVAVGFVKVNFFASDTLRLFYINIEMPAGTPLEKTLEATEKIEASVRRIVDKNELRSVVSTAGQQLTETSPLAGSVFGQVTVSLLPQKDNMASVDEVIQSLESEVYGMVGPVNASFLRLSGGPPTTSPIELKIQGDDLNEIRRAVKDMMADMVAINGVRDIKSDDSIGQKVLLLELKQDAILQAGLSSDLVRRTLSLMVDGEIVSAFQDQGEEVRLRVKAEPRDVIDIDDVISQYIVTPSGVEIPLSELVSASYEDGPIQIVHYNFLRTITIFADIDPELTNTKKANDDVYALWQSKVAKYPSLSINRAGLLDDINESMNNILILFVFGMLLMYLIIATQFRSYFQPFIILFTVFLAFIGVVFGLTVSQQPFSLYTMYGAVALAGIAVNAAIVLVSAANDRRNRGMSPLHAIIYAGRRRVVPILITSMTTIAGLSSLAIGLGGKSALWGPIATVIVWGLAFSTSLTLFVIPGLYLGFERLKARFIKTA